MFSTNRSRLAIYAVGVMGLCLSAGPLLGSAFAGSPYDSFPLAKDVPGKTYATLGTGKLKNKTRWGVYASRPGKKKITREQPCISVARITNYGRYGNAYGCGGLAPQDHEPPVYIAISGSGQNRPGGPVIGEVVMGLSFQLSVQKVKLLFAGGEQLRRQTKLFNSQQARKTNLAPFRYLALGMQRDVCVESIVGYSEDGTELFETETGFCPVTSQ